MSPLMLRAEALEKTFTLHLRGGLRLPVLRDLALDVHAGECVALAGPSGAGKTTLLRSLYGNYCVSGGRILVHHCGRMVDLARADPRTVLAVRAETLGYVSQFLRVVPRISALEIVAEAAAGGTAPEAAQEAARALLARLGIPRPLHALPPATFSGGEQQRINLARAFIARRPVLLIDEPTASLDQARRSVAVAMMQEAKAAGAAIVLIAHDVAVRRAIADRVLTLTPLQDAA